MRNRDNLATAGVRLKNVQHLPNARPEELRTGQMPEERSAGAHLGIRIPAGVRDAAGKDGDDRWNGWLEHFSHTPHLVEREDGGDIEPNALLGQFANDPEGGFAAGIRDGNFDVDVFLPGRNLERLTPHLGKLIREDLERNGFILDRLENLPGERFVIRDPGFLHQGRIRGQALDQRVPVKAEHARLVGAIGEEFYAKFG